MAEVGDTLRILAEHGPALRAAGFASVTLPDGTSFTLTPATPAAPSVGVAGAPPADVDDADEELDGELQETKAAEAEWRAYWERMTRSSGASVPPFPGLESYRRLNGSLGTSMRARSTQ
jgi:hypothetical protein